MRKDERTASGKILQRVCEVLIQFPDGLPIKDLIHQLDPSLTQDTHDFYERVMISCIPPLKAGWLTSRGYYLKISDEGRSAFKEFPDPHTLIMEAAKYSKKGWLSLHFPRSYYLAGKTKDRIISEVRAARRIGVKRLATQVLGKTQPWQAVLPVQSIRRVIVHDMGAGSWKDLTAYFEKSGCNYHEGGHAIYLPPSSFQSALGGVSKDYPLSAGLKIVKSPGGVDEVSYVNKVSKGDSRLHLNSVHGHRHLTLVANLLFNEGVGPRLFDLMEIEIGDNLWTAYVIQDVDGGKPSMEQCEKGIGRLRELENSGLLRVAAPEGFKDDEFRCPDCERNAFITDEGEFRYIDFQNFLLSDYASYLKDTAIEATEASHFGDESVLRGGRYLYQTVPGVNLPAKRNVEDRVRVLERLLEKAGVSLTDRAVFDVGCNIGMMMGQYLRMGARWAHGWDRPNVVPFTEKLLLALGCTRFSKSGANITDSYDLTLEIPEFLKSDLAGCVVSYLAVRGHIGWLKSLAKIPWTFLIYEGHESETREDFESYLKDFRGSVAVEVAAIEDYFDGDSDRRTLAILRRV